MANKPACRLKTDTDTFTDADTDADTDPHFIFIRSSEKCIDRIRLK